MKKNYKILILLVFLFNFSIKNYAQIAATYNSNTSGTLSGVPFAVTNINAIGNYTANMSWSAYAAAPLPNSPTLQYLSTDNITVTFNTAIPNLRLYFVYWRAGEYSFDQPFTILSGNDIQNTSGNTIVVSSAGSGIIEFTNPITTLNVSVISAATGYMGTTFGLSETLSIDSNETLFNDIKLFPNPSTDFIQIKGFSENERYSIYNMLGVEVMKGICIENKMINIQELAKGMYFLKVNNNQNIKFFKE